MVLEKIFEEYPWQIQEVVRKTRALHDELVTFCQLAGSDTSMDQILSRWKPPPKGLIKINVDDNFLEDRSRPGAGGVVCGHDGSLIAGFTHFENHGDALMADYTSIICESDGLKAVNLIHNLENASLHVYAFVLLKISDALHHGTVNLVHILREQNICADFMVKEASYSACSTHYTRPPVDLKSPLQRDNLVS